MAEIDVVLDAMIAGGYPLAIVDLAALVDVDDMATSGMAVTTNAAKPLVALDRRLTVHSPSAKALHLFETSSTGLELQAGTPVWPGMSATSAHLSMSGHAIAVASSYVWPVMG